MFLLVPYRARIQLQTWPVLSVLIVLACLTIYYFQARNEARVVEAALQYCDNTLGRQAQFVNKEVIRTARVQECAGRLVRIHVNTRPDEELQRQVSAQRARGKELEAERLAESYAQFAATAPRFLTAKLWFERPSWNVGRMLTSAFSHGSWSHVIFNSFFFMAFAATVEILLGPVLFALAFLGIAFGHSVIDTLVHLGQTPVPSLGLSGVVMGMMALFVYFVPQARIKFFYWILIKFGTIAIPAWLVVLWFVGGDMYDNLVRTASSTNFIAHLGGAALGLLIGLLVFRRKRHWAQGLVIE